MTLRFLVTSIFLISTICFSQIKEIKGAVQNFENNTPLAYVNIGIAHKRQESQIKI